MKSVSLWRIATDTADYEAHDLTGKGAEITGGRWNRKGVPVVYTSTSIALAALETIVHLDTGELPLNRYLVEVTVPMAVWDSRKIDMASTVPVGWDARPASMTSHNVGDAWLKGLSTALYQVPSVVVGEEYNVLINPKHSDASKITARKIRPWHYDPRLRA
jgi:RES domain-containing protein